ncbi:hypothetical protein QEL91_004218 [Pseudomonas putida]|nr:hypothetical protein [Pseudomonas putida]
MLTGVLLDQAVRGTLGEALVEAARNRKARAANAKIVVKPPIRRQTPEKRLHSAGI